MEISKGMQEAIANRDLLGIYSSFYTILMYDPGFAMGQFDETLRYVKSKNIPGLMQPYNGTPFKGEAEWTVDYWDLVASQLMDNFCQERIDHLRRVGHKVYPAARQAAPAGQYTPMGNSSPNRQAGNYRSAGNYGSSGNYGNAGSYGSAGNYGSTGNYGGTGNYGSAGNYGSMGNYGTTGRTQKTAGTGKKAARDKSHENAQQKNKGLFGGLKDKLKNL